MPAGCIGRWNHVALDVESTLTCSFGLPQYLNLMAQGAALPLRCVGARTRASSAHETLLRCRLSRCSPGCNTTHGLDRTVRCGCGPAPSPDPPENPTPRRSEERRVGKECRARRRAR